jgi:type VI secretion system protein ImpE
MPLEHIESVEMLAPKQLRDLLWARAIVRPAETFRDMEMGEVIVPAIAPLTWHYADGPVRLGRVTQWEQFGDDVEVPVGQKLLLVDGEEFPILEIRDLTITPPAVPVAD